MKGLIQRRAIAEVPGILADFLEIPKSKVNVVPKEGKISPDLLVEASGYHFLVECKGTATRAPLLMALQQIAEIKDFFQKDAVPLIVVPYMGKSGIDFCQDHDLSWIDFSGNAHIKAPGLLIHVEGRPNRFKNVGRPASVFAPKSARIARQLLIEPGKSYNQRELSQITGLDEGHTSRIVRRLEELNLIVRNDQGALRSSDPDQLLDAWLEAYDFSKNQIIKGHIAARSGEELLKRITKTLAEQQIEYAATGLSGAWQYTHFAKFRLVTLYLAEPPGKNLFDGLHFREDSRGANTWLVVPNDTGVFHGSSIRDDIVCVHSVQIYLDLKGHPERAKEAASMIRHESLKWRRDG
jgi:DNA-binding MarR family transcriptional regulator